MFDKRWDWERKMNNTQLPDEPTEEDLRGCEEAFQDLLDLEVKLIDFGL